MKGILISLMLLTAATSLLGQSYNLSDIHERVFDESFVARSSEMTLESREIDYTLFTASLRPQVGLVADLPNYTKTSSAIVQPDGSIFFQSIRQSNSSVSLFGEQVIASTGTRLFALSNLRRFDDFGSSFKSYNGIPVRLGFSQDILGFNPWKYQKRIQEITIQEARRQYTVDMESARLQSTDLYFSILIARQNLELAETNVSINENLKQITEERYALGKISRDERLQVETELQRSVLNVSLAGADLNQSIAALNTLLGEDIIDTTSELALPLPRSFMLPELQLLKEYASEHRPEYLSWLRQQAELESAKKEASWQNGVQINLQGSLGLARGAEDVATIYRDPFTEQQLNLSVSVPLVNWNQRKNSIKAVEIQEKNLKLLMAQQALSIGTEIEQRYIRIRQGQRELQILAEIVANAEDRFEISNQRYILGDLDLTNLTLAQQDMNQSQRSYTLALRDYWINIYQLQILTGYNFIENKKIIHQ